MPGTHLKQLGLLIVLVVHLLKTKKGLKNLRKQKIHIISTNMTLIKLVFNMIWLMVIRKIWLKEHNQVVLRDKAFEIASNPKYDGYQRIDFNDLQVFW